MKTLSERRAAAATKAVAAGKPVTTTAGQVTRLRNNLRAALTFMDRNFPGVEAAHPHRGYKNARDALHGPLETSEEISWAATALLFVVSKIMEKLDGQTLQGVETIEDSFVLLTEFGLMTAQRVKLEDVPETVA
jgi:hypothetical protein